MTSAAATISPLVECRPVLRRSVPVARSSGTRIARKTWLILVQPEWQAADAEHATRPAQVITSCAEVSKIRPASDATEMDSGRHV